MRGQVKKIEIAIIEPTDDARLHHELASMLEEEQA